MISEVISEDRISSHAPPLLRTRLLSGLGVGGFGLLVVWLGGWWFTAAVGVIVHLGLLEFFRMAQFKGIRPATKTTLVACQLLLFSTQWAMQGGLPEGVASAVLPLSGAAICAWLLLQPVTTIQESNLKSTLWVSLTLPLSRASMLCSPPTKLPT